jgi:hypothetical protein
MELNRKQNLTGTQVTTFRVRKEVYSRISRVSIEMGKCEVLGVVVLEGRDGFAL